MGTLVMVRAGRLAARKGVTMAISTAMSSTVHGSWNSPMTWCELDSRWGR